MKKSAIISLIGIFILTACRPVDNKQSQLAKLERQRDALDTKIAQLKTELEQETNPSAAREKAVLVRIEELAPALFQHFIKVQGTVESDYNILLPAQASGIVKKIHVSEGSSVSRGQLLAELDAAILESSIAELETGLQLAATIFERQQRLWDKNIGSEIEYLQAKNNKEGLERKLETLQEQLRLTKIISPIGGRIDDILIKEGEMAVAGQGAIRIVQLSRLKVVASLAENYVSRVKRNDTVHIEVPVLGIAFDQTIDAVSQVIDPDSRTFQIEIKVPRSTRNLKPNALAVVTINDYTNPAALTVPQNAVQETGTEQFLFVAVRKDGRWVAERRAVLTGVDFNDRVEITSGLSPAENVVTFGFQDLADGQLIAVER